MKRQRSVCKGLSDVRTITGIGTQPDTRIYIMTNTRMTTIIVIIKRVNISNEKNEKSMKQSTYANNQGRNGSEAFVVDE